MRDETPDYTSVAALAARAGTAVPCAGNLPVKLDDPDSVWFIDRGAVNLFLVEFEDGVERAAPQHLLRREAGHLLPGVAPDEGDGEEGTRLSVIAKGSPGTVLETPARVPVAGGRPRRARGTDGHLAERRHGHALAFREPPPARDGACRAGPDQEADPLHAVRTPRGGMDFPTSARGQPVHGHR